MASLSLFEIAASHYELFNSFYDQLDPNSVGSIAAIEAARFLKKSDLSDIVLGRIWDIADYQSQGCLDKKGFFIALKLIALAQTGKDIHLRNLTLEMPPPKMGDVALKPNRYQSMSSPLTKSSIEDWSIKQLERERYDKLFQSLNPVNGFLPGDKVKGVLMDSKLPLKTLGKIWDLADVDKDGMLSRYEFVIAMHLVYKALEKHTIPSTLPDELMPSSIMKPKDQPSQILSPVITMTSQQPEPVIPSNPELDMLNREINDMLKEKSVLENEVQQKDGEIKVKNGEFRSLQGELDTLAATLKQLESQQGEAQKRLNDLKNQVDKLRTQANEQADLVANQEKELSGKSGELDLLRNEEQQLEMSRFGSEQKLNDLTNKFQESQLNISQIKSKIAQFQDYQRQLENAVEVCDNALEMDDYSVVPELVLQIEPEFKRSEFYNDVNPDNSKTQSLQNGHFNVTQKDAFDNNDAFFKSEDPFNDNFESTSSPFNDPFQDQKTNNNSLKQSEVRPDRDAFASDPFAILHAPSRIATNSSVDNSDSASGNISPSPALPPKKGKSAPPRPAPPKKLANKATSDQNFADFDDFDTKFASATNLNNNNYNDAFSTNISTNLTLSQPNNNNRNCNWRPTTTVLRKDDKLHSKSNKTKVNHLYEFPSEDPFRDFRYEDPFDINDPFSEDNTTNNNSNFNQFDSGFVPDYLFDISRIQPVSTNKSVNSNDGSNNNVNNHNHNVKDKFNNNYQF